MQKLLRAPQKYRNKRFSSSNAGNKLELTRRRCLVLLNALLSRENRVSLQSTRESQMSGLKSREFKTLGSLSIWLTVRRTTDIVLPVLFEQRGFRNGQ